MSAQDMPDLAFTSMDVGNATTNVIPGEARAAFNIRFNDTYSSGALEALIRTTLDAAGCGHDLDIELTGESFLTPPGALAEIVKDAVQAATVVRPEFSTTGGTSDARFIKDICPVVEFGTTGLRAHAVDERVKTDDLVKLASIYRGVLERFFA